MDKKKNKIEKKSKQKVQHRAPARIGYIFMVVFTVILALIIIPMCWCIPMTLHVKKALKEQTHIGKAFKVCTLIFVCIPAGVLLLCDKEKE